MQYECKKIALEVEVDIDRARTFLEIVHTGSFLKAAERLHVTQTTVSARVRMLEEELGRRLFIRNRNGARLTSAGVEFERFAQMFMQVWERARQQLAVPSGKTGVVSIAAELSLWNPLFADWLVWMHRNAPHIALGTEVDTPDRLIGRVQNGTLDAAVLYSPQHRPNLITELLAEEKLVMVTSAADGGYSPQSYIHVDWGQDFSVNQQSAFPDLTSPVISISLGPLALSYILTVGGSGYFRLGVVRESLQNGTLFRVPTAPDFSHSIYLVRAQDGAADMTQVREGFKACLQTG